MGAWGHGIYESDVALDAVGDILSMVRNPDEGEYIQTEVGQDIPPMLWNPGYGKFPEKLLKRLLNRIERIEEYIFDSEPSTINEKLLVYCDIVTFNGGVFPKDRAAQYLEIIESMSLPGGECDSYDEPLKRKSSIARVIAPLRKTLLDSELNKDEPIKRVKNKI